MVLKIFVSGAEQEKLIRRYRVLERYEAFLLVLVDPPTAEKVARRYLSEDITSQYTLRVGSQVINTLEAEPAASGATMDETYSFETPEAAPVASPESETAGHHYLVVFEGPIKQEWLEAVSSAGGELCVPYQNFTYVVNSSRASLEQINQLPFVRWSGQLPTWSRIATALRERSNLDDTSQSLPRTRTLPGTYLIEFFDPSEVAPGRLMVEQLGATVSAENAAAGLLVVSLEGDAEQRYAMLEALAAVHGVRSIRERAIKRTSNDLAPGLMGAITCALPNSLGLSGEGELIAVADTGLDSGDPAAIHPDFQGRVAWIKSYPITDDYTQFIENPGGNDGSADQDTGHGTHVAGSALGSGSASLGLAGQAAPIRGLAHQARLVFQAIEQEMHWTSPVFYSKYGRYLLSGIPLDLTELFADAYTQGARIHSNSWGGGDPGAYDTQCEQLDRFAWEHKDFLILVAAGNDGSDRDQDGQVDPQSVSSPGTAKNCLTIGACESQRTGFAQASYGRWWPNDYAVPPLRDDRMANNPRQVAAFSSRGPTLDGRIKPDLVAPGTFILSARSTRLAPNNMGWGSFPASRLYFYNGGTSMATPLAAGAAALVREYLRKVEKIENPSAALIKAALVAGAKRIHSNAPRSSIYDNEQGYGRLNLDAVLAPQSPTRAIFREISPGLETGQNYLLAFQVESNAAPLRITLAYTDYPGRSLVNNLNLILRSPSGRIYAGNAQAGKLALDNKNNLEVLQIKRPRPGTWQLQVSAANVPHGPQDFALVLLGPAQV